jgi:alkylation response protein AidB-like acyl-CoA dehydrogenase
MFALLSPEQELLAETVRSLAAAVGTRNPADLETADHKRAWQTLAESGLLGLRRREGDGTVAASGVDVMVVAHELGAALVPVPYVPSAILATELLELASLGDELADDIASGQSVPALLLRASLTHLAEPGQRDAVLVGGAAPDYGLALRPVTEGWQLVRVEVGDTFVPAQTADFTAQVHARAAGHDLVQSDIGTVLSHGDLQKWTALALTLASADCAGALRAALDGVVEYSKSRIAYQVPIGSFQALQHLVADAFTSCEAAVTTNNYAAWAIDELDGPGALLAARTAKAWVASVAREVSEVVMQIYGGIGQTWEHIAHVYARRALLDTYLFGDKNFQLDEIFTLRQEQEAA